ncbi:MAG: PQQ-binding-like beta-propeller repeat protein [Thermoplasmata archaeon]|nr:PQQ-binding-like beta-propeller repeat protein [Thermoplasmata archaeon]
MKNHYIPTGVIFILILFVVPSAIPMTRSDRGDTLVVNKIPTVDEKNLFDYYSRYQIIDYNPSQSKLTTYLREKEIVAPSIIEPFKGKSSHIAVMDIMNSSWPMYCHDTHHTGRSPYSTAENPPGVMKWRFENDRIGALYGSSVIDKNGIIYFGGLDFFAVYPNGTLKWQYGIEGWSESCPAIDSNGTIYVASAYGDHNYIYAFYPNGIMKWRYYTGNDIFSSPAIGVDGTIFFGCGQSIVALFPNGTLRWQHSTNHVVYSSPVIGDDGTVYCGCHDTYLYALYPNNGTMKWMFKTGDWIRVSPCIADDGTIYCVSLDSYLYAIYPNGTMKWRTNVGAGTSPTIGQDGTIYAGWSKLYAVNPVNGSVKWIFNSSGAIQGGTPCNSLDGTIYFGTISGYLIAVNPNGTEAGRAYIGKCESAPAIGEDGTIYIGSMDNNSDGYLNAFGPGEPKKIEIQQPEPGKLYLFGLGMGNTLLGNTAIIGSVKVKVQVYSEDQIESVHFYIDGTDHYNLTKPPFEWRMNHRYGDLFPLKHTITVTGFYKGSYSWSESIDVMYFHLL